MKKININYCTAILGGIAFCLIYGIRILNPFYTDWLLTGGDLTQHYLGWEFFRRSRWFFPFGMTDQLAYPLHTSVIYTDSIPLFALSFKIIGAFLPQKFQYFGIWGISCFILQGYWAAKILGEKVTSRVVILIGSIFFIFSPIMLFRMYYHSALAAHWLILLSIFFYERHEKEYRNWLKTSVQWGILGVLIGLIHLYFVPMCGSILLGYVFCSIWKEKKVKIKYLCPGFSFGLGLFLTVFLLGGFSSGANVTTDNLGLFSLNLNAFVNPMSYSTLFKNTSLWNWPFYALGQYEGFSYLGIGIIILCFCGILSLLLNRRKSKPTVYHVMVLLISIGLILFAASPTISWNDVLVFQLPYSSTLYKYWSIFGSCGRMAWPVVYFLMIFGITSTQAIVNKKRVLAYAVLAFTCALQLVDLSDQLRRRHEEYSPKIVYQSPLEGTIWDRIAEEDCFKHIVWVSHNLEKQDLMDAAIFATNQGMTMGKFYFARGIDNREIVQEQLQNISDDCIYVFLTEDASSDCEMYINYEESLNFYPYGKYMIGVTKEL